MPARSTGKLRRAAAAAATPLTFPFAATSRHYLRIAVTANTGWQAGEMSELAVFAS
ncbi:MAG: hypothetical protein QOD91_2244 [Frankiales bacterium]|nr:hypothetical protein [Frankiales bacterium]